MRARWTACVLLLISCESEEGPSPSPKPYCGDGLKAGDEECDDGNDENSDACLETCELARCGDGWVRPETEFCDDGSDNSDSWAVSQHCNAACTAWAKYCGDGTVDSSFESCDDGPKNGTWAYCNSACTGSGPRCGDGYVDVPYEACDDGDVEGEGACLEDCTRVQHCGDGRREGTESCDDGYTFTCGRCDATCIGPGSGATCGDFFTCPEIEECDDGASSQTCTSGCTSKPILDASAGYSCAIRAPDDSIDCSKGTLSLVNFGQSSPPSGTFARIALGRYHACALAADGTLKCWGRGTTDGDCAGEALECGQARPPAGLFRGVAVGDLHSCGLQADGVVRCWGVVPVGPDGSCVAGLCASGSRVGDGCATEADCALGVVLSLDAAEGHTCSLGIDREIYCWGEDAEDYGELVAPPGPFAALSAGENHTCALRHDGAAVCWGLDDHGQSTPEGTCADGYCVGGALGRLPCSSSGDCSGRFTAISAGWLHTCALQVSGVVRCWGAGQPGGAGYFDRGQSSPAAGQFARIAAGELFSCAARADGSVACWGDDNVTAGLCPQASDTQCGTLGAEMCCDSSAGLACDEWSNTCKLRCDPIEQDSCANRSSCCDHPAVCHLGTCMMPGSACSGQADCLSGDYCETAFYQASCLPTVAGICEDVGGAPASDVVVYAPLVWPCWGPRTLSVDIGNDGRSAVPAGTPVSFYEIISAGEQARVATVPLLENVFPGDTYTIEIVLPGSGRDIHVRANDDGTGARVIYECDPTGGNSEWTTSTRPTCE